MYNVNITLMLLLGLLSMFTFIYQNPSQKKHCGVTIFILQRPRKLNRLKGNVKGKICFRKSLSVIFKSKHLRMSSLC